MVNKHSKANKGLHIHKASIKNALYNVSNIFKKSIPSSNPAYQYNHTNQNSKTNSKSKNTPALTLHNNFYTNPRNYKYFTLGIFAFLLAFISSAALIPIANSSAESSVSTLTEATGITIYNTGDLSLSADNLTSSGQLVKKTDEVTVGATSAPNGYKLYLSTPTTATTNRLYLSGNTSSPSYISPNQSSGTDVTLGNETTLASNSWGFTNSSANNDSSKYSAVPLSSAPALIDSATEATTKITNVYYAVNANTNLPAGNYTGTVVYTALADIVEQKDTIDSITPNYNITENSTQQVRIAVTFPVIIDNINVLTNITATIGGSSCTGQSYALSNDTNGDQKVFTITCTAPTQSTNGAKDIVVSAEKGSFKYTFQSGTSDTSKKYYYNSERGLTLTPNTYEGNESTTTSITATFPSPVQDLGTTAATLANETEPLTCTNKSTVPNTTSTTLTMICTIPAQTSTSTQALTVTSTAFSDANSNPIYAPSADFTYTYTPPYQKMQDFTIADCNNLAESTSTVDNRQTLMDSRDGKTYNIAKLADGNCWMVENLALNGTNSNGNPRTLTTEDTNIDISEISSGSYTFPSGVDISVGTSTSYDVAQIVTSDQDKTDNGNKYGNYYNYVAATVGIGTTSKTSGNIASSVCPKGWRLPAYAGTGSFNALGSAYSLSDSNVWNTIRTAPLYFPAAGGYYPGVGGQGSNGRYWSRGVYGASGVINLNFHSGSYSPMMFETVAKLYGYSVRCVFDPPTMQNFTSTQCANLSTTTATADNRMLLLDSRDGKEYKVARLADGNCWMTENLALNGTDESGNPRTLTTADTNIDYSEMGSRSSYTFPSGIDISSGTLSAHTTPQIYTADQNKTDNNNKYGNYYNYVAATLGIGTLSKTSGDIASSVCPKGWRLPAYSSTGSFQNLGSAYSLSSSNVWDTIRTAPLYFPAAGQYSSRVMDQGSSGLYWSRRVTATDGANSLYFYGNSSYDPQRSLNKISGFSVRCVFEN